jgi:hypothetical protein
MTIFEVAMLALVYLGVGALLAGNCSTANRKEALAEYTAWLLWPLWPLFMLAQVHALWRIK